jgi:hypothetical protein
VPHTGQAQHWVFPAKVALLALLTVNTAFYLFFGTRNEALDSPAWLALLVSFEVEAGLRDRLGGRRATAALRGIRWLAAAALVAAGAGYVRDKEWLDVLNVGLWIAVVLLLELRLRRPAWTGRVRRAFAVTAAMLYAGLVCLVAAWLLREEWFDAYDAALWLTAFAVLELDLLGPTQPSGPGI